MSRPKQILFYCLMAVMTLVVIEGMGQAAYYIAYGEFNGVGPAPAALSPTRAVDANRVEHLRAGTSGRISHPYYGYTRPEADYALNQLPPPRRQEGVVLIALVGGSMGLYVTEAFRNALEDWFRDNAIPLRPVVLGLAYSGIKQPQQVMHIANTLALGGEYDIIVNLDGRNELAITHQNYFRSGLSPFYPYGWQQRQGLTGPQMLVANRIYALRQRQQRIGAAAGAPPWRWSALYGIVNRYLWERADAEILTLNYELANTLAAEYDLENHGPVWPAEPDDAMAPDLDDLSRIALRVWYRSSVLLNDLAAAAGAEYYHFQQPNQYVPDSKPLTSAELADAYDPHVPSVAIYRGAYPMLRRLGEELRRQGINYYDLTQIFADHRETLYINRCCHVNARGNALLAESMVQHLAPALRRRAALALSLAPDAVAGAASAPASAPTATALDAAIRESSPAHTVNKLYFDVRRTDADTLHYSRADCRAADTAAPFFVRITPVNAADRRPASSSSSSSAGASAGADGDGDGFANGDASADGSGSNRYDFGFREQGGVIDAAGQCVVEYRLPDYAAASVLTGQVSPETGQTLWSARITLDLGFEVQIADADTLRYARDNCLPVHLATEFFLHITPAAAADLAPGRAAAGFNNYDFPGVSPADGAIAADGSCIMERPLPQYDIASINTGQYIRATGRRLWETRLDPGPP